MVYEYNQYVILDKVYQFLIKFDKYAKMDNPKFVIENQVNRILERINNPNDDLSWFNTKATEDMLVELISSWIITEHLDRKIMSQLGYKGIRYRYESLIGECETAEECVNLQENENKLEKVSKTLEKLEDILNPWRWYELLQAEFFYYIKAGLFRRIIPSIYQYNNLMYINLMNEKQIGSKYDVDVINYKRVTQYMFVTECMLNKYLQYSIIKNRGNLQTELLRSAVAMVENIKDDIKSKIVKYSKTAYQYVIVDEVGKKSFPIGQIFTLKKQYEAYYEELKKIEMVLIKDIGENAKHYEVPAPYSHRYAEEYETTGKLVRDVSEKEESELGGDDNNRLQKVRRYICLCNSLGDNLGDANDVLVLRIIYQEIFVNKAKTKRGKTSLTIAKKRMNDETLSVNEEIFLDKKIERGWFREFGVTKEYILFLNIMDAYRGLMMQFFDLPEDSITYKMIRDTFERVISVIQALYEE